MLGLRTNEGEKFEKYFSLVQEVAKKKDCTFFLDTGMGKIFENDFIECEDISGWLIPDNYIDSFEKVFYANTDDVHKYDDFYCYIDFEINKETDEIVVIIN